MKRFHNSVSDFKRSLIEWTKKETGEQCGFFITFTPPDAYGGFAELKRSFKEPYSEEAWYKTGLKHTQEMRARGATGKSSGGYKPSILCSFTVNGCRKPVYDIDTCIANDGSEIRTFVTSTILPRQEW